MIKITPFTKNVVLLNAAVPAILLSWDAFDGNLGADPVRFSIRTTGWLALVCLLLSLAITPLMRAAGWNWLGQFRRGAGLYAFYYALAHFLLFFFLDRAANAADAVAEITKRTYLQIGAAGLLLMVPLAVTSTNAAIRGMGAKRWKLLHRSAYMAAIAGVLHYFLSVKADATRPLLYAVVLTALLAYRLFDFFHGSRPRATRLRIAPAARDSQTGVST